MMPKVGDTVCGKYRIDGVLGEGGMAVVFRANDANERRIVALKVLRPEMAEDEEAVLRFKREALALGQLRGPRAVRVLEEAKTDGGLPFLAMELAEGHDLRQEIELRGAFPIDEATFYVREACLGIAEAHANGIVHRDLKPSNLFLADVAGARSVKLLDFGLSKVEDVGRLTIAEASFGTPLYMSPEQVRSSKDVDARADVWSLGVILYELLVGHPPFTGGKATATARILTDDPEPPRALRAEIPEQLEKVVLAALAKEPDARTPSAQAFADALAPFAKPIRGERLAMARAEAARRRAKRGVQLSTDSPTLVRTKLGKAPRKREIPAILWVGLGLLVGLPVAWVVVRLLLGM
jgi:serine/threonine-protein kinase